MAIAVSISVAIKHPGIDALGRWILSVLSWLLPLFSILSMTFIVCLPFSGLQALWRTGQASTLMLLLQFGTIILANSAWRDGAKKAFKNTFIELMAKISLVCLPVYFVLCLYSISLRIEQYGLSTDRVHAMFLVVVTGICGLGYALAVLFNTWPRSIGGVNMGSVLFMLVLVLLMNTPVLDPYRLSAFNQARRLQSGQISPDDFDYIYTRFHLGRFGNNVLGELARSDNTVIKENVQRAMSLEQASYADYLISGILPVSIRRQIISSALVLPKGSVLPSEYITFFVSEWGRRSATFTFNNLLHSNQIAFLFINIERDSNTHSDLILFTQNSGSVYKINPLEPSIEPEFIGRFQGDFDINDLQYKDVKTKEPAFMDLIIGQQIFQILEILE